LQIVYYIFESKSKVFQCNAGLMGVILLNPGDEFNTILFFWYCPDKIIMLRNHRLFGEKMCPPFTNTITFKKDIL